MDSKEMKRENMTIEEQHKAIDKHIGIITTNVHTSLNYGGVLQAYALQKVITDLGYECDIIQYSTSGKRVSTFLKSELHENRSHFLMMRRIFRLGCSYISARARRAYLSVIKTIYLNEYLIQRSAAFSDFKRSQISLSTRAYTRDTIHNSVSVYDIFVCGSDMIWRPGKYDPTYFLDFVPDEILKIAYAPSIGVSQLSESEKAYMAPLVNRLDAISVRESRGKELLEEITDKEVAWVLDPTMLLTRAEWDALSKPYEIERPYLFCYLLGKSGKNYNFIKRMAKERGLLIVTIPFVAGDHLSGILFGDKQIYDASPEHFITLIRNAEMVITDSFHGTVFSILYNKEFLILPRSTDTNNSPNSRIESLCILFGLKNKHTEQYNAYSIIHINNTQDNEINSKLIKSRSYSKQYLEYNMAHN